MKRILVPSLVAALLAPLTALAGGEVEFAGGPQALLDASSAVEPVAYLERVFRRNGGCACQAPSCAAPACAPPSCAARPACGCETSACCKNPCNNGLLGRLRCRLQAAAARRRCCVSRPSCAGCTTPTCGAVSCLAAARVRRWMGCGCGPALSSCAETPGCCAEPCKNYWGNYCTCKRPSLADAMRMAVARYRARRCCSRSACGGCTTCCAKPGCTSCPGGSIQSPFMDDEDSTPPVPPTESRLKPLGSRTAMGTGMMPSRRMPQMNVRLRPIVAPRPIRRTAHTEEIEQGSATGSSNDVFSALAEDQLQAPQRLTNEQRQAEEIETQTEATADPASEVSALPTLIRFIK